MTTEFCLYCGAGVGKFRREGEGTCPKCDPPRAKVITKSEKEHVVVLGAHEIGTSKHHCDAALHANVINSAIAKALLDEAYRFRAHFHAQGPFDMPFGQLNEIVSWMDNRVSDLEKAAG